MRKGLGHGAWIDYVEDFLSPAEADAAFSALLEELAWEQRSNVVFGEEKLQPRLCAWAGGYPYRFSGQTLEARAPTPTLAALSERVVEAVVHPFNHVVVNRYRDGRDWIARHSDNERELGYRSRPAEDVGRLDAHESTQATAGRRSGDRHAYFPVRTGVSHADFGTQLDRCVRRA